MSHFTKIDVQITDVSALLGACAELGLELQYNAEARGYGNNRRKGRYVIRLSGPYDIAINPDKDGHWQLETDFWQGHVERELGTNLGKLRQAYAVRKTMAEAQKRNLRVRRKKLPDGRVRLAVSGM